MVLENIDTCGFKINFKIEGRKKTARGLRRVAVLKRLKSIGKRTESLGRNHFDVEMESVENKIYDITGFYSIINDGGYSARVVMVKFAMFCFVPAYACTHIYTFFKVDFDEKIFKAGMIANLVNIAFKGNYIYFFRHEMERARVNMWTFETTRCKRLQVFKVLTKEYENARRIAVMFLCMMIANAFVWEFIPLIFSHPLSKGLIQGGVSEFFNQLPSAYGDLNVSSTLYRATLFWFEMLSGLAGSYIFVSTDVMVIALSFLVRDQFKVLNRHLKSTIDRVALSEAETDKFRMEITRHKMMKCFVKDHQRLLR